MANKLVKEGAGDAQVDTALLSRTSNTYGVLTSDDPFQYRGGIARTVRQNHWQSLHNVHVRDQYQLGTRQWVEGDNRTAFAHPQVSPSLTPPPVLTSLAALCGVGLLLALGVWRQTRRSILQTLKTT